MFLTETDLINMRLSAEAAFNRSDIIKNLIHDDISSIQKQRMGQGERYYVGEQDILLKDFRSSFVSETNRTMDYKEEETIRSFRNPNRSNHHNVNPFHRVMVEQKVSYIVGREPSISVIGASNDTELQEYERYLSQAADEEFNSTIQNLVVEASNKGVAALHVYYDKKGSLQYFVVPSQELILVYDTAYQRELEQVVRYYDITIVKDGRKCIRKKVEWWTKTDVTYYTQNDNDLYVIDTSYRQNPSPHWYDVERYTKHTIPHSWGRVPFVVLNNNSKNTTDLQCIKGLMDAYDLISSEGTNNFLDLVELYWVIKGYGGETAGAIARKLQINKSVEVSGSSDGSGGGVEAKQVELPVAGRLDFLKMLRRDIFNFGMGIDVDADKFGNAPSGVSLKFQYAQLDLKADSIIPELKKAIKDLFWFITDDYNRRKNKEHDSRRIAIAINKNMISNDLEVVNMINLSKGTVSDKTLLARHPFVDDVNGELLELEAQQEKEERRFLEYPQAGDSDGDTQ